MNISEVTNPRLEKIGKFHFYEKAKSKMKFIDIEIIPNINNSNTGRVYFITADGVINKIGSSEAKGGIKKTAKTYCDQSCSGRPSDRTAGLGALIYKTLKLGKIVEIYAIVMPTILAQIDGLYGSMEGNASISAFYAEEKCREDYKEKTGHLPIWNLQEAGLTSPEIIKFTDRIKNKTFQNRQELLDYLNGIDITFVDNKQERIII